MTSKSSTSQICFAGRCENSSWLPVPPASQRVMIQLDAWKSVSFDDASFVPEDATANAEPSFGTQRVGSSGILFRFEIPFDDTRTIHRAQLVMYSCAGTRVGIQPVTLQVSRIQMRRDAWTKRLSGIPRQAPLRTKTTVFSSGGRPLRIDVTELVREHVRGKSAPLVLAVVSEEQDGVDESMSVDFSLGFCGVRAPVLDVYLR